MTESCLCHRWIEVISSATSTALTGNPADSVQSLSVAAQPLLDVQESDVV